MSILTRLLSWLTTGRPEPVAPPVPLHAYALERVDTPAGPAFLPPRCESRKREGSRSWRCARAAGHDVEPAEFGGWHVNKSGDRRW